jgi:ABC-type branched-subunit amino acid transport system permease subunit
MGCTGAVFGNMVGYIEPLEVAFPVATFGIFMVAMSLLGGKGTLWGPVLGAIMFHVVKETTWTYLLGFQWVVLGLILIVNIVYFQQGIMGGCKQNTQKNSVLSLTNQISKRKRRHRWLTQLLQLIMFPNPMEG